MDGLALAHTRIYRDVSCERSPKARRHENVRFGRGGLSGATLLTSLFPPALYITWFRIKELETKMLHTSPMHDRVPSLPS
jgi:hypothetical protein